MSRFQICDFRFAIGSVLRWLIRGFIRLYYSTVSVSDGERVPGAGPVLFVSNHPNSLIDPVLIGMSVRRPVHFLAKAPLFQVPILGKLLHALGMVPAFRGTDDRSQAQLKKNVESLARAAKYLAPGEAVGIFPEGKSHDALKVEMVRSGAARMAMQALEAGAKNLKIVPLGLNYERKEKFGTSVWVRIGEPIEVDSWLREKEADEHRAIRQLTQEIDRRLKDLAIHLNEEKWEPFLDDLETLVPPGRWKSDPISVLRLRKRIADAINHFLAEDRARAEQAAAPIAEFHERLAKLGLSMRSPVLLRRGTAFLAGEAARWLWLVLWALPALTGTLFHLPPFALVRLLASRLQHPGRTTTAQARLLLSLPVYLAWYCLVAWAMWGYFLPWVIFTALFAMPFAGLLALNYWPKAGLAARQLWRQLRLALVRRPELRSLRAERAKLQAGIQKLSEEYGSRHPIEPDATRAGIFTRVLLLGAASAAVVLLSLLGYHFVHQRVLEELRGGGQKLAGLPAPVLDQWLEADEKTLSDVMAGLDELEAHALRMRDEFAAGKRSYYKQQDNDALHRQLLAYVNYRTALLRLIWRYQNYSQIDEEQTRLRAALVGHAAAALLYESSLKFATEFGRSPEAARKLNEGDAAWGIPGGLYDKIRRNLASPAHHDMARTALKQYDSLQPAFRAHGLVDRDPHRRFHALIHRARAAVPALEQRLDAGRLSTTVGEVRDLRKAGVYRTKTLVSTWIGDLRIRAPRGHAGLISGGQVSELRSKLRPGDILIERHNWHLSNAFLPGYWPHAALYVGTADDLRAMGLDQDPRVQKHLDRFSRPGPDGHRHVILEALSEGVIFNTLEHSAGTSDSVAVFRPNLDESQVREGIARAFSHAGKPYDFEFDFFSTDKLVCTEVIFRTFDGSIELPLVDILGTKTLPAIDIVRKYSEERDRPAPELGFVAFLDGDESAGKARFRDASALAGTIDRSALTWLQSVEED